MANTHATTDARALLRHAGLRVTKPRLSVIDYLTHHPHAAADRVAGSVREDLGSVSTQAVYDVLHALTGAGIARRIEPAGSSALFELRSGDNHHHLVCRSCGLVVDVDCAEGSAPCLQPAHDPGFEVDEAEIVFWGHCSRCAQTNRQRTNFQEENA